VKIFLWWWVNNAKEKTFFGWWVKHYKGENIPGVVGKTFQR